MKYETQKLINWIKSILNDHKVALKKLVNDTASEVYDIKRREAIDFLESLPEIESHLCRGGYIQDKNGTPCCAGEAVYFLTKSKNSKYGYLVWDMNMARFLIEVVGEPDCRYIIPELEWFKKVEFEEVKTQEGEE